MNEAKAAVKDFMSKSGHHDTTVHETVAPAVTKETHHQHKHEDVTTAIDKEVHQDHYHTSVQPVHDQQRLPEQHHHNLGAVEHRQFEHGNDESVKQKLEREALKFKDTHVQGETRETSSVNPTVAGEHIHHHVHENIQPVVHRQTVEPHVVHTTVPIHEVHHNEAQHHSTSALPAVSLRDFKAQGGSLTGREERNDGFEGEPRAVGSALGGSSHHHHNETSGSGLGSSGSGLTGRDQYDTTGTSGSGLTGRDNTTGSGLTGRDQYDTTGRESGLTGRDNTTGSGLSGNGGYADNNTTTTGKKPGLLDRMNPMKDTDGDGKKGMMD